jgi:ABC-type transport system involved in multi-copper enzyme maturation permease subunit
MANRKYLAGLILIVTIVWITMILCLAIVYTVLPPLDELSFSKLAVAIVQLLVAGSIILLWLYSWNILVRFYFRRNMNAARSVSLKASKRKH